MIAVNGFLGAAFHRPLSAKLACQSAAFLSSPRIIWTLNRLLNRASNVHFSVMSGALIPFVEAMGRCWIERRYDDLADLLAPDIVMVAPGGTARVEGLAAAIESYRGFMARAKIERFEARDYILTEHGITAIVEYRWDMAWDDDGTSHQANGREILVLSHLGSGWRVVWRTQLAG